MLGWVCDFFPSEAWGILGDCGLYLLSSNNSGLAGGGAGQRRDTFGTRLLNLGCKVIQRTQIVKQYLENEWQASMNEWQSL